MKSNFYGEWVHYESEDEKEQAKQYLKLWKKFFLKKNDSEKFVGEQWVEQPAWEHGALIKPATLALKIQTEPPEEE